MIARLAVLATLLVAASASMAQVHRWVDERGIVQYGDRPPVAGATTLRVPAAPPPAAATAAPAVKPPGAAAARPAGATAPSQTPLIERKLAQQVQQRSTGAAPLSANSPGMGELIAQCKANRGVDCDTPQGMRTLQRENTPITSEEQARIAGLRARRASCARVPRSLGC